MSDVPGTIYGLRIKGSTEARYIGRTLKPLEKRLYGHLYEARRMPIPTLFARWLNENRSEIEIFPIRVVSEWRELKLAERDMILACVALNHRLFNQWLVPADHRRPTHETVVA